MKINTINYNGLTFELNGTSIIICSRNNNQGKTTFVRLMGRLLGRNKVGIVSKMSDYKLENVSISLSNNITRSLGDKLGVSEVANTFIKNEDLIKIYDISPIFLNVLTYEEYLHFSVDKPFQIDPKMKNLDVLPIISQNYCFNDAIKLIDYRKISDLKKIDEYKKSGTDLFDVFPDFLDPPSVNILKNKLISLEKAENNIEEYYSKKVNVESLEPFLSEKFIGELSQFEEFKESFDEYHNKMISKKQNEIRNKIKEIEHQITQESLEINFLESLKDEKKDNYLYAIKELINKPVYGNKILEDIRANFTNQVTKLFNLIDKRLTISDMDEIYFFVTKNGTFTLNLPKAIKNAGTSIIKIVKLIYIVEEIKVFTKYYENILESVFLDSYFSHGGFSEKSNKFLLDYLDENTNYVQFIFLETSEKIDYLPDFIFEKISTQIIENFY